MTTEHAKIAKFENNLLPHIVDRLARERPNATYVEFPRNSRNYDEGLQVVTWSDLANVVNGLAWFLKSELGVGKDFEILTYTGPNDIRYIAMILAAVKAGYVLFLTSPRNSQAAHASLLETFKCRTLLSSTPLSAAAETILSSRDLKLLHVPSVDELLSKQRQHFPFDKTYEDNRWDPIFVVHTSGSTGIPKPITWYHETCTRVLNTFVADPPADQLSMERMHHGKRCINFFPPFHGACLLTHLLEAIPFGTIMISPPAEGVPTAEALAKTLEITTADFAFLVPQIVAELSWNDALLDFVSKRLDLILYAGGDLPTAMGNKVASKMSIRCQFGASEIGLTSQLEPPDRDPLDWRYIYFHPCIGIEFEEVTDGLHELVVRKDMAKQRTQSTFTIGPHLKNLEHKYESRDLFQRHPTNTNLWCWRARADDIIVFLNGEKTNPISMEQYIVSKNSTISAALVVGAQRLQAGLLLEPMEKSRNLSTAEEAALIEEVWPWIKEANALAPAHARIEKALVLVVPADKPIVRAGKGTIQRAASLALLADEIETLYQNADLGHVDKDDDEQGIANGNMDITTTKFHIKAILKDVYSTEMAESDDFFTRGFDSLQALQTARRLRRELKRREISTSVIYSNPSINQLSQAIVDLQSQANGNKESDRDVLGPMLEEFRQKVKSISISRKDVKSRKPQQVILTGSTGTLGTYLLEQLLENESISHVYCLNRREDSKAVQEDKFIAAGFAPLSSRPRQPIFLNVDLAQPKFGLDDQIFNELLQNADLIIHNAWPVNFNLPLESFRPQLNGLLNLQFSASSSLDPKIFFVSSVSSVGNSNGNAPAPETLVDDPDAPMNSGYAMSKWLSEQILVEATKHLPYDSRSRVWAKSLVPEALESGIWQSGCRVLSSARWLLAHSQRALDHRSIVLIGFQWR